MQLQVPARVLLFLAVGIAGRGLLLLRYRRAPPSRVESVMISVCCVERCSQPALHAEHASTCLSDARVIRVCFMLLSVSRHRPIALEEAARVLLLLHLVWPVRRACAHVCLGSSKQVLILALSPWRQRGGRYGHSGWFRLCYPLCYALPVLLGACSRRLHLCVCVCGYSLGAS